MPSKNKDNDKNNGYQLLQDLLETIKHLYDPCEFVCSAFVPDKESHEYGAYDFKCNNLKIKFRIAKITPKKIGQFVTLWKRTDNGSIQPYDKQDPFDYVVVSTRDKGRKGNKNANNFGQFVFPKSVLCEKGVVSINGRRGKLAIRIYPPWDVPLNKQAKKTQAWQLDFFLDLSPTASLAISKAKILYCPNTTLPL